MALKPGTGRAEVSVVHALEELQDDCGAWRTAQAAGIVVLVAAVAAAILALGAGAWFRATVIAGATAPAILASMLLVEAGLRRRG